MCCRDYAQSVQDGEDCQNESLCLKIKARLEDLFSDSHLVEDGFLLKHMQKNRQGYVSLKLLTSLRKMKALSTNWHMTLAAAECSNLLEVNDECTKVRRVEPLPKWLLCSPTSRLLLAWNISEEQSGKDGAARGPEPLPLSDRILQKFSVHSNVISFWILPPGKELPKELQCYVKRHKELGQHWCAVAKFASLEAVRKAYNALKAEEEKLDGKGMCVVPLGFQSMHHVTKDEFSEQKNRDQSGEETHSQENPLEISTDFVQQVPPSPLKVPSESPETYPPQTFLDNSNEGSFSEIFTKSNVQSVSGLNQRSTQTNWSSGDCDKGSSPSPWVLRRKFAAIALNSKVSGHLNAPCLMQRVLRQPLGPDGTKGFQGRGLQCSRKSSLGWGIRFMQPDCTITV
ncbi:la-related protein 6-like [Embiotoca jacksoni]|uniref:la-related protein 6-like n=1 Tax=Embiotoca jacksoni TaxID=100190 RepID=UPI0037046EEE